MKNLIYLIALMFAVIITSCTDEDNPHEGGRLRITKMAYNANLDNPSTFEYDLNNHLVKLILVEGNYTTTYDIENNADGKPIKITYDVYDGMKYTIVIDIEWTDDGFIFVDEKYNEDDIFKLDSQGRIIKKTKKGFSYETILNWNGDDNLTVDEAEFKFNGIIHPLSNINIAILQAIDLYMGEWETEWQNNYCINEYRDGSMTIRLSYDVNEQNYPTLMKVRYGTNSESLPSEYMSFEYESY